MFIICFIICIIMNINGMTYIDTECFVTDRMLCIIIIIIIIIIVTDRMFVFTLDNVIIR